MTQRLRRTTPRDGHAVVVDRTSVVSSHAQVAAIVAGRLGRAHAEMLATPALSANGEIDWNTSLTGPVVAAADLGAEERDALTRRADRMLGDIRGLAAQLVNEGDAAQPVSLMLGGVTRTPPGDWLYSVGGRPVIVMWGHATEPGATPTAAPAAVPAAAMPTGPQIASPEVPPKKGWAIPLALALLALAAIGVVWWMLSSQPPRPDLSAQIVEAEGRCKSLETEIAAKRAEPNKSQCVADVPAPAAEPPKDEPPKADPPKAPDAKADPFDDLKKKIDASAKDCSALQQIAKNEPLLKGKESRAAELKAEVAKVMAQNCKEKLITEARNLCPGVRPKELAPEMAIVFDASKSMDFGVPVTEAQIDQALAMESMAIGPISKQLIAQQIEPLYREPKRITSAKQAALVVGRKLPSDANIGLVLVDDCPGAKSLGFYPPGQRSALLSRLQGIQPVGGTPLADGVKKAGRMLDGVTRESLMLVISDGRESCSGDPCAEAAALARAKPHLRINVVDITGTGAGNCLAAATHGKVFTARNASDVMAMVGQAANDAMAPGNCKGN